MLFRRRARAGAGCPAALARAPARPDVRARAAEERARPGRGPAARRDRLGHGLAGEGDGGDAGPGRAARRRAGFRRGAAPVGPDGPRSGAPASTCSPGSRRPGSGGPSSSAAMRRSRATSRTACRSCARWPSSATRSASSAIPCYPEGHAFIADAAPPRGARREGAVRDVHDDPDVLRPGRDRGAGSRARRPKGSPCRSTSACPGVAEPAAAAGDRARIGVADTHRFLAKNTRFVARLRPLGRLLPAGRRCSRPWPRSSREPAPGSWTCTCTRSTRSPSSKTWRWTTLRKLSARPD